MHVTPPTGLVFKIIDYNIYENTFLNIIKTINFLCIFIHSIETAFQLSCPIEIEKITCQMFLLKDAPLKPTLISGLKCDLH